MSEILLRQGADPSLDGTDDAALNAMLEQFDPSNPDKPLDIPGAVVETPPEPPPVEPPVVEATEAEPVPEIVPEPEIDLAASEREGERITRKELEARVAFLEAHGSRLAGKLGFYEQKFKSIPQASEPYEPQSQVEVDRLASLEQRLEASEQRRIAAEVSQAVKSGFDALDGPWTQELSEEIKVIAPRYADQIKMANESTDPESAREMASLIAMRVQAEAERMRWDSNHKRLVERKAATVSAVASAKRAQTVSGSGAVATPPPKLTSIADMTADEADKWMRENVR